MAREDSDLLPLIGFGGAAAVAYWGATRGVNARRVSSTTGMFLGALSAERLAAQGITGPRDALAKAAEMKAARATAEQIHSTTSRMLDGTPYAGVIEGLDRDGNRAFMFEVDDSRARLHDDLLNDKSGTVDKLFRHDELRRASPSTGSVKIRPVTKAEYARKAGSGFDAREGLFGGIRLSPDQKGRLVRPDAVHELQHAASRLDRLAPGGNPSMFSGDEAARKKQYRALNGEEVARLAEARTKMTAAERRATFPRYDTPLERQGMPSKSGIQASQKDDISDFGEKIGGARKDTARKGVSRGSKSAEPKAPAWERQFVAMESTREPGRWYLFKAPRGKRGGFVGSRVGGPFPSEAVANAAKPLAAVSQNHMVTQSARQPDGSYQYQIRRKTTNGYTPAADGRTFATRDEGLRYMAENAPQLLGERTTRGFGEELLRQVKVHHGKRIGPEVRTGEVTPDSFLKTFGPRGVEFGHWEEGARRQKLLNAAFDSLHDLSAATGLKPNQLTFGGSLGVSFGARGTGGLRAGAATYHPDYGTMNMTKPAGAGALAHEWLHALDHAMARADDPNLAKKVTNSRGDSVWVTAGDASFASNRVAGRTREAQLHPEVRAAYADLMKTMTEREVSEVEDTSKLRTSAERQSQALDRAINQARRDLEQEVTYRQRNNKPATPEQLARFDEVANAIRSGRAAAPEWKFMGDASARLGSRGSMVHRYSSPELETLSGIMKEVRGRSGFDTTGRSGPLDEVARALASRSEIEARIAKAEAGRGVVRKEATEFLKAARELDRTRTSPYWTERHEMFARAGEAFVFDKLSAANRANPYLVAGASNSFEAVLDAMKGGLEGTPRPFPEGAERQAINQKFERLFEAVRTHGLIPEAPNTLPSAQAVAALAPLPASKDADARKVADAIADVGRATATHGKGSAQVEAAIERVHDVNAEMSRKYGPSGVSDSYDRELSTRQVASAESGGRGPVGWSDAARAASADARAADPAGPATQTSDPVARARAIRQRFQSATVGSPEYSAAAKEWGALPIETQRAAIAAERASVADVPVVPARPGAESYGEDKIRAQARANILNRESGGASTYVVERTAAGWTVQRNPNAPALSTPGEYPTIPQKALHEIRNRGDSKKHFVYADGKPVKDSKGQDKWFGSREKAQAFIEKREASLRAIVPAPTDAADATPAPRKGSAAARNKAAATNMGDDIAAQLRAADRLQAVAERTIADAQAIHDQPRLMNTARRARMGSGVMEDQQRRIANAKTALQIATALREGNAGPLVKIESLADVERLTGAFRSAMYANEAKRKEHRGSMVDVEPDKGDISHARPDGNVRVHFFRDDVEVLKGALKGKGVARELARLEQIAARPDPQNWQHSDPRDIEAIAKVARAVKSIQGSTDTSWAKYRWQPNRIQSNANTWLGAVREYEAKKRLGLTDPAQLRTMLETFADVRVGRKAADPAKVAERNLVGMKLPGFFPTPESLATRMADLADIRPGQTVLEPSAGTGRLADVAKARGAVVDTVEVASSLRDVLAKKGHNLIDRDFTSMPVEPKYDRVLMNPPFEKGQDMAHVQRAYDALKPGGKLVAVMGEGPFFRSDSRAEGFREWLSSVRGTSEKLPEGTFKESNTGVNTRLVVIEKPTDVAGASRMAAAIGDNAPPADASVAAARDRHAAATDAYNAAMRKGGYTEIQAREAEMRTAFDDLKGKQTGWSDEARAAAAEARAANAAPAEPGPAVKAARANDVRALAAALKTNTSRAADVLRRFKKGSMTEAHLEKLAPAAPSTPAPGGFVKKLTETDRKLGVVAMIGAPIAAGLLAFDATRSAAKASGKDDKTGRADALKAGAGAAAVTAGTIAAIGFGIKKAFQVGSKVAPKLVPGAAVALAGYGLFDMARGAVKGYQKTGTAAGAAFGAISGGEVRESMNTSGLKAAIAASGGKQAESDGRRPYVNRDGKTSMLTPAQIAAANEKKKG